MIIKIYNKLVYYFINIKYKNQKLTNIKFLFLNIIILLVLILIGFKIYSKFTCN